MRRFRCLPLSRSLAIAVVALGAVAPISFASAANFRVLHSFCVPVSGGTCSDGYQPVAGLVRDAAGNLYGTTSQGFGENLSVGTVFELALSGTKYKYKSLYDFCTLSPCNFSPQSGLIIDGNGTLYGTTSISANNNCCGAVFELFPKVADRYRRAVYLYTFCVSDPNCTDGNEAHSPVAALTYAGAASGAPYDGTSPLFGTTVNGGTNSCSNNCGVAYKLGFQPGHTKRRENVVWNFLGFPAGRTPTGLTALTNNKLYGIAEEGGNGANCPDSTPRACGTVFELTLSSKGNTIVVLHNFCTEPACADGEFPTDAVRIDSQGQLVGTTQNGGNNDRGTLYRLVPNGTTSQETVLHHFCSQANCADGATPAAGVAIDGQGNIFGTAFAGGAGANCSEQLGCGVVFEYTFDGTYKVLHRFCSRLNCADGEFPHASVVVDPSGNIYGTTFGGGANGAGTVYEMIP